MEWLRAVLEKATITDGKLDVEAVSRSIATEFPKHAVPKIDFNAKVKELEAAEGTITELKKDNKNNEALQGTIENYEKENQKLKTENDNMKKTYSLTDALKGEGCYDPGYLIYNHGGLEKFSFDEEGKPVGVNDIVSKYMENKILFPTGQKMQNYNPMSGNGDTASNPFAKETWNMTEQGKLFKENPAQARELAKTAGITI